MGARSWSSVGARCGAPLLSLVLVTGATACSSSSGAEDKESDGEKPALRIEVISSRAEYVSGGDALVAVTADQKLDPKAVRLKLGGKPVDAAVEADPANPDRVLAKVGDLPEGKATIVATRGDDRAEVQVVNHPLQGPVFAGEQLRLVGCSTQTYGLAASTPEKGCFAPTRKTWEYVTTEGERQPLADPAKLPADVQNVDVGGQQEPFVISVETGVINRSVYRTEIFEPAWNKRLVYRFGGGCGATFTQGFMGTGASSLDLLKRGYATATATFNTYQVMCNDVLSGETASMVKEHFAETYGVPELTIGEGGSGGAIQQLLLAQNYPGLLDGIAPSVPFPDAFSISEGIFDCALLERYYASPAGKALSDAQRQAINGHATSGTCGLWARTFATGIDPKAGCTLNLAQAFAGATSTSSGPPPVGGITPDMIYDAKTNPDGLRCTVWESNVVITGRDPETGFARSGYDNVGVQYGLDALNAGTITPQQFLELNATIGGFDEDGQPRPARSEVPGNLMGRAYDTGRVTGPWGGLPDTPIILINVFTDQKGDIHDRVRSFSLIDRLTGDDGKAPATVSLWTIGADQSSLIETLTGALGSLATGPTLALDEWLTAARKYQASKHVSWQKALASTKPEAAESRCILPDGKELVGPDANDDAACRKAYPISEEPRMAAGAPRKGDVLKCQLTPVSKASSLYEVPLSAAEKTRLAEIFPDGVCDYTKPSVGFGPPTSTWMSFDN